MLEEGGNDTIRVFKKPMFVFIVNVFLLRKHIDGTILAEYNCVTLFSCLLFVWGMHINYLLI